MRVTYKLDGKRVSKEKLVWEISPFLVQSLTDDAILFCNGKDFVRTTELYPHEVEVRVSFKKEETV